jgi:hypothetical protein
VEGNVLVDATQVVVEGFGQSCEELCFSSFALISRNSYFVENRVQLADDCGDLSRQVTGIHGRRHVWRLGLVALQLNDGCLSDQKYVQ